MEILTCKFDKTKTYNKANRVFLTFEKGQATAIEVLDKKGEKIYQAVKKSKYDRNSMFLNLFLHRIERKNPKFVVDYVVSASDDSNAFVEVFMPTTEYKANK